MAPEARESNGSPDPASALAPAPLRVSGRAARRIRDLAAEDPKAPVLRVAVEGGGCSGFQYAFALVAAPDAGDRVFARDGARVAVDPASLEILAGSELDWADEMIGASFRILNPRAESECGCGVSFSLAF